MPESKKKRTIKKSSKGRQKRSLMRKVIFFALILGFASLVVGAGVAFSMVYAVAQKAPEFNPDELQPSLTSNIYDGEGEELTSVHGEENRLEISLQELPDHVLDAFIAVEDRRFYDHSGVDLYALGRALWVNLQHWNLREQGGSTITQQLARNAFLTSEQTLSRKIQEAYLALQMERYYAKEEILEKYLNHIYFGGGAYGVEAAALTYFEKSASDLSVAEAALLAGIIRSPTHYSPFESQDYAYGRQQLVLSLMRDSDFIGEETWEEAREEEAEIVEKPDVERYPYPYYIDYVIHRELVDILAEEGLYGSKEAAYEAIYNDGLQVYTVLQPEIQGAVEEVLENDELYPENWRVESEYLERLKEDSGYKDYPEKYLSEDGVPQPQSAAVVADPTTGALKALVGGRDYGDDNRSLRYLSPRQPGSAIKPLFAYVPAMEEADAGPATVIDDSPLARGDWAPENFDRRFRGLTTVREALVDSVNVPAVKIFDDINPERGVTYGERMGLSNLHPEDATLASVLGGMTHGTSAMEMVQAFSVLANEGVKVEHYAIERIEDRQGQIIYENQRELEEVLSPETSYLINDILVDVTRYGTAENLEAGQTVAAKTGTTSDNRDAWLVTYSPDFTISFWMGHDVQRLGRIEGGSSTTIPFMNALLPAVEERTPASEFERPEGISGPIEICSKSGLNPGDDCPEDAITIEIFPQDAVPTETCDLHVEVEACGDSGLLVGPYCPEEEIEEESFLDRPDYETTDERWRAGAGRKPEDAGEMPPEEECDVHTEIPPSQLLELLIRASGDPPSVDVRWVEVEDFDAEEHVDNFELSRKEAGAEDFDMRLELPPDERAYLDEDVEPGREYIYRIEFTGPDDKTKQVERSVPVPEADDPEEENRKDD